jgi:hypothetical protein
MGSEQQSLSWLNAALVRELGIAILGMSLPLIHE